MQAVDEAHEAGAIHRDLKPQNLFLARVTTVHPSCACSTSGIARAIGGPMGKLRRSRA
ncbi:MAG: hypothetical protein KF850_20220 [Labilithrix sp.]|nr:hypothetical protein [Labilithrix sp.]